MIKLNRDRTKVTSALRGRLRIKKLLQLLEGQLNGAHQFNSAYWKNAKDQLKAESEGKCAYCEATTTTVAHGDVEHFRPKSEYWWLAYCYDNYLFACQICNQTFKSDHFPVHGTGAVRMALDPPLPIPFPAGLPDATKEALVAQFCPDPADDLAGYPMAKFLQAVTKEKAGLVDPYVEDPEPLFAWEVEPVLKEVYIKPRTSAVRARRAFAASRDYLGLNRPELVKVRYKTYAKLETFVASLDEPISAELKQRVKDQIEEMMAPSSEFAGMVRYFVTEWDVNLT